MNQNSQNIGADHKQPIDAVITWVDGSDPAIRRKKADLLAHGFYTENPIAAGQSSTRFTDNGELQYCIASIRKFAPWIRHIYLITDNQIPHFLTPGQRELLDVIVVDHRDIFRGHEWVLPTFNSCSIETLIWNIDGLSNRFIYFNDDFVLLRPVSDTDFFVDSKVVCRGEWSRMKDRWPGYIVVNSIANKLLKKIADINRTMNLYQQMRSARLAGMQRMYYRCPHVPHPVNKNTLSSFFKENPDALEHNIRFPFRDMEQFVSTYLSYHIEITRDNAILRPAGEEIILSGDRMYSLSFDMRINMLENKQKKFLCLQNYEKFSGKQKQIINDVLDRITGPADRPD